MSLKLLDRFTDVLSEPDEICDSQPLSLSSVEDSVHQDSSVQGVPAEYNIASNFGLHSVTRPARGTGQHGEFRSVDEIDAKYRSVFSYPFFNLVQSGVIDDALYSDKSMVVCAPTGSGKTVVFEMAIVHLLMELEDRNENHDFKIIYMAPVKALCTERLTEWYSKFTKFGLLCIEVTGDTDVDFTQLKPYRIIITTPEKWDMLTRRWRDHRQLVELVKLFLIDEVHILNDETRGPVLEAVVSRMKTIERSVQSTHRIEQLQHQYHGTENVQSIAPNIRFIAASATIGNPEDVAAWLGAINKPAVYYKFGDECRPVKLKRIVEGYPCAEGTSIFKFDLVLNYKLWPIIQKYHNGKPTLIFCNTRKSVALTAETLSREITISFNEQQKSRLTALASMIKNKKLQTLVMSGVGCHHAGLLYEERTNIEQAFRNRDLPILITTTTLAMGVNLPAHLVIIKNTQQYVSGAYQEYSISTVLQMVGRAGRPQFDTEATAVIMTRLGDKHRYQALVGGSEPLQSYLHKRLPENLNSEAALGTVIDVAQCVQWLLSTFLSVRAAKDPKRYLGLPQTAPHHQISKKIEELCVKAMNGLASSGLITMDEACCIESTEAGRLMSIYYLDLETMKHIMKIDGSESLGRLLWLVCESHELADMHLRMDERRCLNTLNRNNAAAIIRFPMKGKITTRQMKLNCMIQAILGCLPIPDPSLNQEAMKIMRIADRVCKCLVAYVTRPALVSQQPKYYSAILNTITLAKCVASHLWENSSFVSKQLKGIGPTFSTLLATAGKVNFLLLEESHPRDLERIMNKGPPAGNILRKQISLFPKYQVSITPVDEKVVSLQLILLNHHNLTENRENLTAGITHKSYLIVGDSENVLLLLSSFTDKDLIGVYDGSITYQITRKHDFEHKIYAHCVSSNIAGIDAHCEYLIKDVKPQIYPPQSSFNEEPIVSVAKKQTTITETFKERKRKNTDHEINHSKDKKKRETNLFEKFKVLKESFGKTSQVLTADLNKSAVVPAMILQDLTHLQNPNTIKSNNITIEKTERKELPPAPVKSTFFEETNPTEITDDDFINDEFIDDDKINNILNEIECEISKRSSKPKVPDKTKLYSDKENDSVIKKVLASRPINTKYVPTMNTYPQIENYKTMCNMKKRVNKNIPKKSNYNFIDLLEKNEDLSDAEETTGKDQNSFSDTIRRKLEKYLQKTKTNVKPEDITLKDLIQDDPVQSKKTEPIDIQDSFSKKDGYYATLDEKMQLETIDSNNVKPTLTSVDEATINNNTSEKVLVLEHKIQSIDLTTDEFSSINCCSRESHGEQELPAIELGKNDNKCEFKTTDNNGGKTLNEEPDLKNLVPLIEPSKTELDLAISQSTIPALKEKKELSEVQLLRLVEPRHSSCLGMELRHKYNIDTMATTTYSDSKAFGIQTVSKQLDRVYRMCNPGAITLPSTISHVPESSEKQEFPVLKLWENDINELTPLDLQKNYNEVTKYNNTYAFNNQIAFIQQNDKSNKQFAMPNKTNRVPEVKEILDLPVKEPTRNKIGFFTPPYKYNKTCAPENPPPSTQQNEIKKPMALPESNQQIEPTKNNKELEEITYNNTIFGNQLVSTKQPGARYHNLKTPRSNGKENREMNTFSLVTGSYCSQQTTQQNHSKLTYVTSNTVSRVPELQERHDFPEIGLRENYIQVIKDTTTLYNTSVIGDFKERAPITELNYSNNKIPFVLPSIPKLQENQRPSEMEPPSASRKEIKSFNTCALGDHLAFTQQENNSDSSNTNSQKYYINKYSYSSNKIDVSAQETADHVVRVIRKLRIDLNLTEFVYEEEKSMRYTNNGPDIEEQTNKENSTLAFENQKLKSTPSIEQGNENRNKMVAKFSPEFETNTGTSDELLEKHHIISDTGYNITVKHKLSEKASLSSSATEPTTQLSSNSKHVVVIEEGGHSDEVEKYIERDVQAFSEFKIADSSVEKKPNNAESMFQKFSNIIMNRKTDKPRIPFKIYRRNAAPLSSALIEKPKAVNVTKCFNLLEPNDKHVQLEQNKQLNICASVTALREPVFEQIYNDDVHEVQNASITENSEDTDCDPSYIEDFNEAAHEIQNALITENSEYTDCDPSYIDDFNEAVHHEPQNASITENPEDTNCDPFYIEDLEVKDIVSNIDQTMFNPKTLLQCFSTDECDDFIPPPPEFSDYLNATLDTNDDITLPKERYDPMVWEDESGVSREGIHNRSIFQESQIELTPSKEIETWNLSKNEDSCKIYDSPGESPYSFTIMRKNKEPTKLGALDNSLLKSAFPRRNKLKQFKFNHKNKLHLRL